MHFPKPQRIPGLDALRGLFLVWMTLTHLPTRVSAWVNQPFGYVSSAEGFVFLSALLASRIYLPQAVEDSAGLRARLWRRALRLYGYHLSMLTLAFTLAAGLAVMHNRLALYNLLNFYLDHPLVAIAGSVLLIYTPPLLDILPMYVVFLFFTPTILSAALRVGWRQVMLASSLIWLLAQFGLRAAVHSAMVRVTHLPIPMQESGAFNLFAWQWVWVAGLWLGAELARGGNPLRRVPRWAVAAAVAVCLFFAGVRHEWWGAALNQQALGMQLDKWQIGPLRLLNLIAFSIVVYGFRKIILPLVSVEPFLTLGRASLEVFCAHVFFVFVSLALLYGEAEQLHGYVAAGVLVATFTGLILVALREPRRNRTGRHKHLEAGAWRGSPPESRPATSPQFNSVPLNPVDFALGALSSAAPVSQEE